MSSSVFVFTSERIEARKEVPLLNLMAELGGWPVLHGEDWDSSKFDWVQLIGTQDPAANHSFIFTLNV